MHKLHVEGGEQDLRCSSLIIILAKACSQTTRVDAGVLDMDVNISRFIGRSFTSLLPITSKEIQPRIYPNPKIAQTKRGSLHT